MELAWDVVHWGGDNYEVAKSPPGSPSCRPQLPIRDLPTAFSRRYRASAMISSEMRAFFFLFLSQPSEVFLSRPTVALSCCRASKALQP